LICTIRGRKEPADRKISGLFCCPSSTVTTPIVWLGAKPHREDVRAYNREYQRRRRASCEREGGPHGASERLDLTTCTALGLGLVAQDDGELLRLLILGVLAKADRP